MKTSIDGMLAILADEAVILSTYDDGAGVATIGVGHTAKAGPPAPRSGMFMTLRQALELFVKDLRRFERRVERALGRNLKQHEFDGFVSFDFNTGKIDGGTVDDKWRAGEKAAALRTLKQYNKGGKPLRVMDGLVKRRAREAALIADGTYHRSKAILVADAKKGARYVGRRMVPADEIAALLKEIVASAPLPAPHPLPDRPRQEPLARDSVEPGLRPGTAAGGAAGAIVAGGGAAVAAGFPWQAVALAAGCALLAVVIVWLVIKLRSQT